MLGTRVTRAVYTRAPLKLQLRALGLHRRYVHNGSKNDEGSSTSTTTNKEENDKKLPDVYPQMLALPISRRPLFPGFYKAVVISEPRVMKAITDMVERQQPYIGAFMLKDSNNDTDIIHDISEVHELGVLAQVTSAFPSKDEKTGKETMTALLYPHKRIKIDQLIPPKDVKIEDIVVEKVVDNEVASEETKDEETVDKTESATDKVSEENTDEIAKAPSTEVTEDPDNYENPTDFLKDYNVTLVNVSNLEDEPFDIKSPIINALTSEILKVFKEISQLNSMFREQIATFSASIQSATTNIFEEPAKLADFAAAVSAGEEEELQEVLESLNIEQRLEKSLLVLKKELMNAELQNKISKDVETKIQKRQKEYYLMEQLKGIKRELGIDDGRDKLVDTYKKRVEKLNLPENVQKTFDEEITKLATLETSMSEFGVIRNYLDWLTSLPWGINSKEQYSIPRARKILDEDHYGMKDVKDRILEFIAVGKLLGKVDGKIICFVGPPGVGKTSIGKSISRALNRQFFRFSVGGMTDVAEIKGHRRTYIGALPGRIIQALKKCQTQNPLILIDEIDKIGHGGIHGDPSAALLEVLDPEQNNSFLDNYLDIPIDLSKVLFVCTANSLDTIPRPLLDRMEVIELTGYVAEDKIKIAEQYLVPSAKKTAGLQNANVSMDEEAINALMKYYCRESGVRNLKKHIEKIYRKAALEVVKKMSIEDTEPLVSTSEEPQLSQTNQNISSSSAEDSTTDLEDSVNPDTAKEASKPNNSQEGASVEETKKAVKTEEEEDTSMIVPEDIKVEITPEDLKKYVGPPIYTTDRLYETTPPGVIMGLAWTNMGGCSLYVESVLEQPLHNCKHANLERTGQLGDVMKESSRLAYSFSKMYLSKKFPENRFFEKAAIHLHCPEGATPKDGPSAGVTMATSFLSLALNKPVDPTVAMTGELTLTGKVLRIGGLREKVVAAKRSGAKTVIFPKDNLNDWEELPENVKEGMEPLAADWYDDIYKRLFSGVKKSEGNNVWKSEFELIDKKKKEND
ncbi:Lon protease -like protein, mitochondrial [Nakaseomyces glabratus]|uniref:Lon protease homolog, mitochondrial n=1 Tax=Candida glabrata TaxID=5478 RepID=A0A0W0D2G5_CANGB|nr:ATPase family associated with various cellular activities (AAA) [Nakaseomyces glabratus]KAI8395305.1 ATPase family associated with various cellular activities (AAA) [Nakaseomyces glabratus]KTA97284.1 Lon protease -like protein, mitochondrial [Nakaseomyces glabratus]KTA98073.1 Lon protease -like protein, mitochondrial [Nakaseomyces glabratus]KTB06022.1 Lon protease -like protein, mitochondrial [Nakaseomyces glabratus]